MLKVNESLPVLPSTKHVFTQSMPGCAFVFLTISVTAFMLVINAVLCLSIHSTIRTHAQTLFADNPNVANPISQLFFFIGPTLLTIIQWNLLDRIIRLFRTTG